MNGYESPFNRQPGLLNWFEVGASVPSDVKSPIALGAIIRTVNEIDVRRPVLPEDVVVENSRR